MIQIIIKNSEMINMDYLVMNIEFLIFIKKERVTYSGIAIERLKLVKYKLSVPD